MGREDEIIKERMKKIEELKKLKINPYPSTFNKKDFAVELQEKYAKLKNEERTKYAAKLAGRVMIIRDIGKIAFVEFQDSSGKIQLVLQEKETSEKVFNFLFSFFGWNSFDVFG